MTKLGATPGDPIPEGGPITVSAPTSVISPKAIHNAIHSGNFIFIDMQLANAFSQFVSFSGNYKVLEDLIKNGADIEAKNFQQYDYTPLHTAAKIGETKAAEILLSHGAKVNAKEENGFR